MSLINFPIKELPRVPDMAGYKPGTITDTLQDASGGTAALQALYESCLLHECIHFVTDGRWSLYDFLNYTLDQGSSPANVWLTTYSMTELSARVIAKLKDSGKIGKLHMLMDYKSRMRYPNVDQIIRNITTTYGLTQIHAKVLVIMNEHGCFTLLGSANWTKNPRIEAGIIDHSSHIAMHHSGWIERIIKENPAE